MKPDLVELRRVATDLRVAYQNWGAVNMAGLSPEDEVKLDVNYSLAKHRWLEAEAAYWQALDATVAEK